jgi:hypothetical protein
VLADYDSEGKLLGLELLAPCGADVLDRVAAQESEAVRSFLRNATPVAMREPALA